MKTTKFLTILFALIMGAAIDTTAQSVTPVTGTTNQWTFTMPNNDVRVKATPFSKQKVEFESTELKAKFENLDPSKDDDIYLEDDVCTITLKSEQTLSAYLVCSYTDASGKAKTDIIPAKANTTGVYELTIPEAKVNDAVGYGTITIKDATPNFVATDANKNVLQGFATLAEALKYDYGTATAVTIALKNDVTNGTTDKIEVRQTPTVTIDFSGHTMAGGAYVDFMSGTYTIKGDATTSISPCCFAIESGTTVTIDGGTYTNNAAIALFTGNYIAVANFGNLTIKKGSFTGTCAVSNSHNGTITIEDGTFTGIGESNSCGYAAVSPATTTISGGTFSGNTAAITSYAVPTLGTNCAFYTTLANGTKKPLVTDDLKIVSSVLCDADGNILKNVSVHQSPEAYAVYDGTNKTLTFYYDYEIASNKTTFGAANVFDDISTYTDYPSHAVSSICTEIETVVFDKTYEYYHPTTCRNLLANLVNLTTITGMEKYLNTDKVTSMYQMFAGCNSITTLDLTNFNTESVTDMEGMFTYCRNLTAIKVGTGWETNKVTSSSAMFDNCSELIGGNGTKYSSSHIDHTYACIDGASTPGYFTSGDYKIFYNLQNGTGELYANVTINETAPTSDTYNGASAKELPVLTSNGYTFKGWTRVHPDGTVYTKTITDPDDPTQTIAVDDAGNTSLAKGTTGNRIYQAEWVEKTEITPANIAALIKTTKPYDGTQTAYAKTGCYKETATDSATIFKVLSGAKSKT